MKLRDYFTRFRAYFSGEREDVDLKRLNNEGLYRDYQQRLKERLDDLRDALRIASHSRKPIRSQWIRP
jgi:hypothetical protein